MAQVPYAGGVPEVSPETRAPDDYQHITASPAAFGGQVAEGLTKLGHGVEKVSENLFDISQFRDKIDSDDQTNHYIKSRNSILHGNPDQPAGTGPDGQPIPDLGYMGLKGRAALDARADTVKRLEEARLEGRKNLKSPRAQLIYDEQTRRMAGDTENTIGTHATAQYKDWAGTVNEAGASHAIGEIARNPDNKVAVANATKDLIEMRVQAAQIKHGYDEKILAEVASQARGEALRAQLDAIAVKDPARAQRMADSPEGKKALGQFYDEVSAKLRERADTATAHSIGNDALVGTIKTMPPPAQVLPVLDKIGAPYGISGAYLARTQQLETGNRPNAISSTGAKGPFQFVTSTAKQYDLPNPFNFGQSADRAAQLAANNKLALTTALGRTPSDAEIYLAHNQGATGAAKLLAYPTVRAGDLVGDHAILVNGGDPNRPAQEFTNRVLTRFGGAGTAANVATLAARRADAYRTINERTDLPDAVKQKALTYVTQQINAQEIAENQSSKATKENSDKIAGSYVTEIFDAMHTPNPDYVALAGRINHDPLLANDWRVKAALMDRIKKLSGEEEALSFGPGYLKARQGLFSSADAPGHIADFSSLVTDPSITTRGLQDLKMRVEVGKKSVDAHATERIVNSFLADASSRLSFDQETVFPGATPLKDAKGRRVYLTEFQPMFIRRVSELQAEAQKTGNSEKLDKFLSRENVDKLIVAARDPRQMAMERVAAQTGTDSAKAEATPAPPRDLKVNTDAWNGIIGKPWITDEGKILTKAAAANALNILMRDPTPETIARFNKVLGRNDGADLVRLLSPAQAAPVPEPKPEPPKPTEPEKKSAIFSAVENANKSMQDYVADKVGSVVPQGVKNYLSDVHKR